jgi:hypothetical protein
MAARRQSCSPLFPKKINFNLFKEALMKRGKPKSLADKWKGAFSKGKAKVQEAEKPGKQCEPENKGPSLALVRKAPVTFQLSRLENPKDFELMGFVIKACLKTADNPYMAVLHVEQTRTGSRLVACDGKRLHAAEISKKIKSGNYKPHATKDAIALGEPIEGVKFPDWEKAIPEKPVKRGVIDLESSGLGKDRKETDKLSIAFNSFVKQTGKAINICYLEDLMKKEWIVYSQSDGKRVILLKPKEGKVGESDSKSPLAVIIPIAEAA